MQAKQTGLERRLKILYICLEDCKRGFLARCRPIIGLDACHLKTKIGNQLINVVARDPNDEYFLFAFAVVEVEAKDSWTQHKVCTKYDFYMHLLFLHKL